MIFAKVSVTATLLAGLATVTAAGQPWQLRHWSWKRQSTTEPSAGVNPARPAPHWNYHTKLSTAGTSATAGSCQAESDIHYQSVVHSTQLFFRPSNGTRVSYPRVVELLDGTILATAAYTGRIAGKPSLPIFASCDGGNTWAWRANLTAPANGTGLSAQPALAVLPWDVGAFKKGTALATGISVSNRTGTMIDLYASVDKGSSWDFVSTVAQSHRGGLFEPFIVTFNNTVGVFYSDMRDPEHKQKLAHQETQDLTSWGPVVEDVAYPNQRDSPGMTVVAYLPPVKRWILVHEFPGGAARDSRAWGRQPNPVHYRLADSPFLFRYGYSYPIVVNGTQPNASPYVAWTPAGGPNGTILVSDNHWNSVFTNTWNAAPDKWEMHGCSAPRSYARPLLVASDDPDHLIIVSAGSAGNNDPVLTSTTASLAQVLRNPPDPRDSGPWPAPGFTRNG